MNTQRVVAMATVTMVVAMYALAIVVSTIGDLVPPWEMAAFGAWLLAFAVVGVLIVFRRPGNPIAWLCLGFAFPFAAYFAADAVLRYEMAEPGLISRPELLAIFASQLWVPAVGAIGYLLLLFPDGHLPSHRWKWFARFLATTLGLLIAYGSLVPGTFADWHFENPLGVSWIDDYVAIGYALVVFLIASILISAVSVAFRYRRADSVEKLQLKWLVAAGAVSALSYAFVFIDDGPPWILSWSAIPVAIGFAVLRYRLYDIDRLISRTLSYAVVAGLLTGAFFGAVVLLSLLLPSESNLAVAASTLLVAVLFDPLRRRIQNRVDRRFDRARFDAERVIEQFAVDLRNLTDLDELTIELTKVIGQVLRPSILAFWAGGGRAPESHERLAQTSRRVDQVEPR